jgi:hypothetical protein
MSIIVHLALPLRNAKKQSASASNRNYLHSVACVSFPELRPRPAEPSARRVLLFVERRLIWLLLLRLRLLLLLLLMLLLLLTLISSSFRKRLVNSSCARKRLDRDGVVLVGL